LLFVPLSWTLADGPPPTVNLLDERLDNLTKRVDELIAQKQFDQAAQSMEEMIQGLAEVHGTNSEKVSNGYQRLAIIHAEVEQFQKAVAALDKASSIAATLHGKGHWKTREIDALVNTFRRIEKLSFADRRRLYQTMDMFDEAKRLTSVGRHKEALSKFEEVVAIRRELTGDASQTSKSLAFAAGAHLALNQIDQSRTLMEEAVAMDERIYGESSPQATGKREQLGQICRRQGKYADAFTHFNRTYRSLEKLFGRDNDTTLDCLNQIGLTHNELGNYEQGAETFRRLVDLRRQGSPPGDHDLSCALNNLANSYRTLGHFELALPLFEEALANIERGPDKGGPIEATTVSNLALLHKSIGDESAVLPLMEKSYRITASTLGMNHIGTALAMTNLSSAYLEQNNVEKAGRYAEKALAIAMKQLGPDHPDTADYLYPVGRVMLQAGKLDEAQRYFADSWAIFQKTIGTQNQAAAAALYDLGQSHFAKGEHELARRHMEEAIAIQRKVLGPTNPEVAKTLDDLAQVYLAMGDETVARELLDEANYIREHRTADTQPNTLLK
jgi:tetratricopeptide (TPR) repeat protein